MGVVKYLMDYWTMQERAASQTSITEGTPLISPGKRRISKIRIKISRKCLHTFLVPIELCVLFFYFGNHFQAQVNRQYYFQAIMKDKIRNFYNATYDNFTNESLHSCLNQDDVVNITDEMTFNEGQTEVNTLTLVTTITDDLTRIVTALVLGSLSDRFGRKIFIVMTFFGGFVGAIVNTILFYFNLNLWLFVVISFVTRLFGGDTLLMACSFAYVADITSQRWLTVRIGILEAFKFVAEGFAAAAANKWMDKTDCDDRLLAVLILVVFFVGLVYSFFIAESLVLNAKVRHKWKSKSIQSMTRGVKLLFLPSYLGWSNLWKFWVGLMIILVGEASGIHHIMNFFLHNKPLEWSYDIIGNYSIAISASKFVSLLIFLPLLVVMRIPDTVIMLIGGILDCGMNIFIALLTTTWEMFLAGVILSFNAIVSPSLRSYVKRLIDENDKG
jgi:PCFT/HCP family folate transporter-like MFS transporter 1/3